MADTFLNNIQKDIVLILGLFILHGQPISSPIKMYKREGIIMMGNPQYPELSQTTPDA